MTLRVPRNCDGSEMERDACISQMYEEIRHEQTRRQTAQRQRIEREQNTPREENTVRELADEEDAANWVNDAEESPVKSGKSEPADTQMDAEESIGKKEETEPADTHVVAEKSLVKAENSVPVDTEVDDDESKLNRLRALKREASDQMKVIDDCIAEIEASREEVIPTPKFEWVGPRIFARTVVNEFVCQPEVRPESTVHYKQLSKRQEDRSRVPITNAPEVFLRMKFDGVTKIFFAENSRDEIEVVSRPLRMAIGIQVRYLDGWLEMRGNPQENSTYQIVSTGDPFRLLVAPRFAEINEIFAMTADGLLIRAITPKGLPQISQHVFSVRRRVLSVCVTRATAIAWHSRRKEPS